MAARGLTRILDALGAHDPARERLRKTLYVTAGILGSVVWGYGVIHALHADHALLTVSVFLSLMSGLFVKDSTARARVTTSALLVPTVVLMPLLATALHSHRELQLIVFVLVSGLAMWGRKFGARATAMGNVAFFGYFFTLFMHPSPQELPAFSLILAGAAGMQFVMKLIMWLRRHPERELGVLLRELRVAAAAALDAAASPARPHVLRARLDRVDSIWRAVTDWQHGFDTSAYTNRDADSLALSVMDACVHTEESCLELAAACSTARTTSHSSIRPPARANGLAHALAALDEHSPAARIDAAVRWADSVVADVSSHATHTPGGPADHRLAECVLAHVRLRQVSLHRRDADRAGSAPHHRNTPRPRRIPHLRLIPWRDWQPTSRLAIQAMTATAIASVVGEAISATRWYWAVLTAFLVFLSTTTRSGVLTRAYRRILGTALGLLAGVGLVFLSHGITAVLVAICLLCIMGMIYFAPLNYLYASFFITTMLVALYDMLGVLHGRLLELRLEETIAGCICGVVCAYLLLSTTSRPSLVAKIDVYFDAVDSLLKEGAEAAESPADVSALLGRIQAVEAAQSDVEKTIAAMSTALVVIGRDRVDTARDLLAYASRSSAQFAQIVVSSATDPTDHARLSLQHDAVAGAVAAARQAATDARRRIDLPNNPDETTPKSTRTTLPATGPTAVTAVVAGPTGTVPQDETEHPSPDVGDPTLRSALLALARLTWVMHRLSDVLAPAEDRKRTHAHARVGITVTAPTHRFRR